MCVWEGRCVRWEGRSVCVCEGGGGAGTEGGRAVQEWIIILFIFLTVM